MFSVLALEAFYFDGMANTSGEKKLNEETLKKNCYEIATDVVDLIDPDMTLKQEQTTILYDQLLTACFR
ncbi:MAG: hypothetical protein ACI924_000953 [Flavobacterium sp.]|jgi:hypothetical protein